MNRVIALLLLSACLVSAQTRSIGKDPVSGLAQAVIVEGAPLIHTAQFLPIDRKGELVAQGDAAKQTAHVLENLIQALKSVAPGAQIVKLNVYLANESILPQVEKTLRKPFGRSNKPAVSFVVTPLQNPDALVAIDAIAADLNPAGEIKNVKRLFSPFLGGSMQEAHMAILPVGAAVYISGQAKTNTMLGTSTRATLESLNTTLEFLRLTKSDVVQVKCFLTPMVGIESVKHEIQNFFAPDVTPPCVFVEWTTANPQPIEIELIARSEAAPGEVDYINPPGSAVSKVYTKVVRVDRSGRIYCSALYGNDNDKTGGAQIKTIFNDLGAVLKKAGSDFDHLVKATYFVSTPDASSQLNVLRPNYLKPDRPPAASKAMVKSVGVPGKTVTVDMIAISAP
ncbi:MAG: Endoribonuclease [Verrucomicrobiales bacterium]|nr:Endoribonuclease [Verrucomicrobiales bacterium]